jgi:two-component system, OmpR family, response regulator ResD
MRVLIADADELFLAIAQAYLWERGYQVEVAADGPECLDTLREFEPDVLVLEDDLPGGGREGVLVPMQDDFRLSHIPVILIVANGEEHEGAVRSSVAACLCRPFQLNDLIHAIDAVGRDTALASAPLGAC